MRDDDVRETELIDVVEILGCGCVQATGCNSKMSFWVNFGKYFYIFKKYLKIIFDVPALRFGVTDKIIFLQSKYLLCIRIFLFGGAFDGRIGVWMELAWALNSAD